MKILPALLLTLCTIPVFAQKTFTVENFSNDYYGKIQIADTSEVFSKGWVAIYDRKTNKEIINVPSDELALELHDGKALANIRSLPYGEQSLIIYDDFNFDGKKDLAICDGQNSCYHGPSFKIYLAAANGFAYNEAFTRLAQEYCGMFDFDAATKKIHTMTKDGCCWHEMSEFMVINNKPVLNERITEDAKDMPFVTETIETRKGTGMDKKTVKTIGDGTDGIKQVFSFDVPGKQKKVVLFTFNDHTLYYAVLRKDSSVEFSYPTEVSGQADFQFSNNAGNLSLTFKNAGVTYQVYERQNDIGIDVTAGNQTYNWAGNADTQTGTLNELKNTKPDNVE